MRHYILPFTILILAGCLTQFASDIYAPSVPGIALSLNSPISLVQWSMAIYLIGVALSQLIYGPISEGIGRKKPFIFGATVMLIGSAICMLAPNIETLIVGRFIQGCGSGAMALWRTVFRDMFKGPDLAKFTSYLVIFVTFIIPAAPAIGGFLQQHFDWQASFVLITVYTAIVLILLVTKFKETSQYHHPERLNFNFIFKTYKQLLTSRLFMGTIACVFLGYGGLFSCVTAAPVLLIEIQGLSPAAFGSLFFVGSGGAYCLAGIMNGRLVKKHGSSKMIHFGLSIMLLSGILMLLGQLFIGINSWIIAGPIFLFFFGSTFIWPNAFAVSFTPFGKIAGYAGALYGATQVLGGGVLGGITAFLPENNQLPLAITLIVTTIAAWLVWDLIAIRDPVVYEED